MLTIEAYPADEAYLILQIFTRPYVQLIRWGTALPYREAAFSDSMKKSIGVFPSRRLNIVENALGLLYPRSNATSVMDCPADSRGSAASRQACCRHAPKLIPVCC